MNYITGQLFALAAAVCWAQNSIIYSWIGKKTGSRAVTHVRLWVALPAVMLVNLFINSSLFPLNMPPEIYFYFGLSGFLGFFIADLFIFSSFVYIGAVKTMVIMTFSPVFSALISWLTIGESLNLLQISGIFVIISGIVITVSERENPVTKGAAFYSSHITRGIIYAFTGAFAQAAGMVIAKQGMTGTDTFIHPVSANVLRISAGLLSISLMQIISGEFTADFKKMKNTKLFSLLSFAALAGPVLGIILTLQALSLAPAGIVTTLMQMSPVILIPLEYIVFRRKPGILKTTGAFLSVSGAALLFI